MKPPIVALPALLSALLLALSAPACADDGANTLFAPAEAAREAAEAADALLLAPAGYGAGVQALEEARRRYQGGSSLDAITVLAGQAGEHFRMAARNAAQARRSFTATLDARDIARQAEAFRLGTADWARAEKTLQSAARQLEAGDARSALERAAEAARLYEAAHLQALEATLLTEARRELATLREERADRLAPKTSARAADLLAQATAALDTDPAQTDAARKLAGEATAAARNARSLATLLREARAAGLGPEDLLLDWQASLARMAAAIDQPSDFSGGPRLAAAAVEGDVAALHARSAQLAHELEERDRQIRALEEEIRELDQRLDGASSEARNASLRLAAHDHARERLDQLEKLFTAEEALILRQGRSVIVRVRGLAFAPGSSRLPGSAAPLLEKMVRAIALYPAAQVTVEGHTDSSGGSAANQRLSQARAEALRRHLVEHLHSGTGQVSAIGYGDTRPVARNEDVAGRRENRRIDLVITPAPEALP